MIINKEVLENISNVFAIITANSEFFVSVPTTRPIYHSEEVYRS